MDEWAMSGVGMGHHWPVLPWRTSGPLMPARHRQPVWVNIFKEKNGTQGGSLRKEFTLSSGPPGPMEVDVSACMCLFSLRYGKPGWPVPRGMAVFWLSTLPATPPPDISGCLWPLWSYTVSSVVCAPHRPVTWTKWDSICEGLSLLSHSQKVGEELIFLYIVYFEITLDLEKSCHDSRVSALTSASSIAGHICQLGN